VDDGNESFSQAHEAGHFRTPIDFGDCVWHVGVGPRSLLIYLFSDAQYLPEKACLGLGGDEIVLIAASVIPLFMEHYNLCPRALAAENFSL
jgi:hypothetical protein